MKKIERLEPKHLSHYLLCGLKINCNIDNSIGELFSLANHQYTVKGKFDLKNGTLKKEFVNVDFHNFINLASPEHFKPILRPLSFYCGKMIAREGMDLLNCDLESINEIWDLQGTKDLDAVSVKTYNVMCRNHLDFNFLIESGLAIDINNL